MVYEQLQEAMQEIRRHASFIPEVGVVLGSGLGDFAARVENPVVISYERIPHFHRVSVAGHAGRLVLGTVGGRPTAVLQGRYHYYEGHEIASVVFPVRLLCHLGVGTVLLTNAAGGIGGHLRAGDLMIIRDHINLMGTHPLRGPNEEALGVRFPDMSAVYDAAARRVIAAAMEKQGLPVKEGVYAALSGPSYETPAEIRMLAALGADAVGMSTVPEAIAARHMKVKVAGISCVTNLAAGISQTLLDHREVTETAERVKSSFIQLLDTVIPAL